MRASAARFTYACAVLAVVGALGPWATMRQVAVGAGIPIVAIVVLACLATMWFARTRLAGPVKTCAIVLFAVALIGLRYAPGAAQDAAGVPGNPAVSWGGLVVVACAALIYGAASLAQRPAAPAP